MPVENAPNPEQQADPVSAERGSDDEAIAALTQRDTQGQAPETDEPEPADDAADGADPEAEEAEPEAEPDAEELVEVEIGGKTFEVAPEVQKAVLRQADYSRKMNEVGALEKAYEAKIEAADSLAASAEKRGEALATVRVIDMQLQHVETMYRKARADGNPEAPMLAADLLDLKDKRKEAVQAAANVAREITQGSNQALGAARDEMDAHLKKNLKGWGDELGTTLTKYAQDNGVQRKTLELLTDPAVVIALDKARKYDALQASKTAIKAKAQTAPQVSKPGAVRRTDARAEAMTRLRKDNSSEAAEAAFLARM